MRDRVASFNVDYTRFLDPTGRATQPTPDFANNRQTIAELYRAMVLTRAFDAKAIALQRTGRLGTYASSLGQEAVAVGIGAAMAPEDVLLPYAREHGTQLLRGVTMRELFLYWGGDERGSAFEARTAREDFPISVPVGSHIPHAAGVALAFKLRREARVALAVSGDGSTSKGDFYEGLNLAGAWKLPVVFVVTNNQWAISVPRSAQTAAQTLAQKAIGAGFAGEQVDGNDVIVVPLQVAILGVGRMDWKTMMIDGQPAAHRVLPLSVTFDHRAVTGAEAAHFLQAVVSDLEESE